MLKPIAPLAILLLSAHALPAASLGGRVRELGGIQPLAGARIEAEGLSLSARSDARGLYRLDLPEGFVRLKVSADDFDPDTVELTVSAATQALPDAYLRRAVLQAEDVVVRARREEAPSRTPIKRAEIRRIAGIGRDALRALQTLPGVVTPSDFSGQLAVRGGGPQDNLYFLNEVPWPVPFHYGGALSTVHSDLLESVDLYPAAFPARWGGVDGAILDARSRAPKRDAVHGQLDVNLLLSELLVEGPLGGGSGGADPLTGPIGGIGGAGGGLVARQQDLKLAGEEAPAPLSPTAAFAPAVDEPKPWGAWLVSGRRSYFDLILRNLGDRFTAVPRFWDVSVLGEADLGPDDQLRLTVLSTDDLLGLELKADDVRDSDFAGEFRFRNYFGSAGLNWVHKGDGWRSTLTPYTNVLRLEQSIGKGFGIRIRPTAYGVKEDLRYELGAHELGLGFGVEHLRYDVFGYTFRRSSGAGSGAISFSDPAGITISASSTNGSAYLQDRVRLARGLSLTLGTRWQKADGMTGDAWDPRASVEWQARPSTRLSAGWGLYSQFPTPRELSRDFGNPQLGFARTEHVVAGLDQRVGNAYGVKLEAYQKTYRDRIVEVSGPEIFSNDGEGYARGLELLLKREGDGRFFGWISYSLAESWRLKKGDQWRRYQYDQPHTLTLVGSYNLTPAWSVGSKVNWRSGTLITPVLRTVPDSDPTNTSGVLPVYGEAYSERLDDYIRTDIRTDYAFRFRGWRLNLYAEILNVFGRPNPAGVTYNKTYTKRENVNNLPFLPYLGLGAEF